MNYNCPIYLGLRNILFDRVIDMTYFKSILIVATFVFFPFHFSWGMNETEQKAATTSGTYSSVREISKEDFFARQGKDIKVKKSVPRPGISFTLEGFDPEKLTNLQTYDPAEVEKEGCLIFHGVHIKHFKAGDFERLYGDYIDFENPTPMQMVLGGLWSNLCMSASLIHPSKSPTWSAYGLTLRVPYPLIYLADYEDVPRTTHAVMQYDVKTFGDYCITSFNRRDKVVSREQCLRETKENWHNEIQFVPEAVVDGIPYSVTVTGLWARDTAEEKLFAVHYAGMAAPVMKKQRADIASPEVIAMLKGMSAELGVPLTLSSEWEKE